MYSLWLKPRGDICARLRETIDRLARELGTPAFEPHVTLLAPLEGTERQHLQRTSELARQLKVFEVTLTEAAYTEEHFRCLFMTVLETRAVRHAHAAARRVFPESPESPYRPHLSLVYGSLPESRKQQLIAGLPEHVRGSFAVGAVHLITAESDEPKDWHELAANEFVREPIDAN